MQVVSIAARIVNKGAPEIVSEIFVSKRNRAGSRWVYQYRARKSFKAPRHEGTKNMNKILICLENASAQTSRQGRQYFSFSVRLLAGDIFLSTVGWKYYPDSQTISTPSQAKGDGKFINTVKMSATLYNRVQDEARRFFGDNEDVESAA